MGDDLSERFRAFIEQARAIRHNEPEPVATSWAPAIATPKEKTIADFRAFVAKAEPIVTSRAREALRRIAPDAQRVLPWLTKHDLIAIAGYSRAEESYTRLLQWALEAGGQAEIALRVQRALLEHLGIEHDLQAPLEVRIEVETEHGRPDLVLFDSSLLVVIEAKTDTQEHETPNGLPQTVDYPNVGPALDIPNARVAMVFLTPDRRRAANPEAKLLSFAEIAFVLANAMTMMAVDDDLRAGYRLLITHWLERGGPRGFDVAKALRSVPTWLDASDRELLRELGTIHRISELHHGR